LGITSVTVTIFSSIIKFAKIFIILYHIFSSMSKILLQNNKIVIKISYSA
jgi:hypothetical protein